MTYIPKLPDGQPATDDDEINLLELLFVVIKHKFLILGLPFAVALIAAGYSLTLPDVFTAKTMIMPPQGQSGESGLMAQIGGIAALAGVATKGSSDVYVTILKSRTVADRIIERFELMKSGDTKRPSQVRESLAEATNIVAGKDGIITIEIDDKDPKRAAEIANGYVDELLKLTQALAMTHGGQRRLFFERQFGQAKSDLAKAEIAARQGLERGGLVKVDEQGRAMIANTARLRAQITVKEVEIGAMRTYAADRNPNLQFAQKELESLKRELATIEGVGVERVEKKDLTGQGMDGVRLLRDVKYHEVIFDVLARQYEIAKVDEAKESAVVQVLDKAIEPDHRSKPKRTLIVVVSALVALIIGIFGAFTGEAMERARSDPQQAAQLRAIKSYLSWR